MIQIDEKLTCLLGVGCRDKVTRVGFKHGRVFLPGIRNGLAGGFPSQRLEVLGKVEGTNESEHMGVQAVQVGVVKGLDGAVHPPGLPVCSWAVRPVQFVNNAVFIAHPAKDVPSQKGVDGLVSVLGQLGNVNVQATDFGRCKLAPPGGFDSCSPAAVRCVLLAFAGPMGASLVFSFELYARLEFAASCGRCGEACSP